LYNIYFEYEVYLSNYTKIKNVKNLNWAFEVIEVFTKKPKNLGFKPQFSGPALD